MPRMTRPVRQPRPTRRMRAGRAAEALVADYLVGIGWTILGRNVRVGRSELDLVAVDPGPPALLVVGEVRANRTSRFGLPEESVDRDKLRTVYRGAVALRALGRLPDGTGLPRLPLRVDVVSVELAPRLGQGFDGTVVRHLRGVIG
jgi:putative endonuclease